VSDTDEITELLTTFFSAFVSGDDISSEMAALRAALLPNAVIVKTCGSTVSYTVDEFIAPREAILTDGTRLPVSRSGYARLLQAMGDSQGNRNSTR